MTEQRQIVLPPSLMKAAHTIGEAKAMSAPEKFEAIVLLVIGYCLYTGESEIKVTSLAIPELQWLVLCQLCTDLESDPIAAVNYGLSWVNVGPSAFKDAQVPA